MIIQLFSLLLKSRFTRFLHAFRTSLKNITYQNEVTESIKRLIFFYIVKETVKIDNSVTFYKQSLHLLDRFIFILNI